MAPIAAKEPGNTTQHKILDNQYKLIVMLAHKCQLYFLSLLYLVVRVTTVPDLLKPQRTLSVLIS